jgi:hypothetical protein
MVPRKLHQIWIGPNSPPTAFLETWQAKHPDWEYQCWRESDIDSLGLENRATYDALYQQGLYAGAADIARAEILYQHGGVYADADSECVRPLDGAEFMDSEFWIVREDREPQPFLLSNAFVGAERRSKPLRALIDSLATVPDLEPSWTTTGPLRWTYALRDTEPAIVEPQAFYTHNVYGETIADGGKYARHEFGKLYKRPEVSVVVPYCDAGENRERLWRWLEPYWMHRLDYAEFILQPGPSKDFSKTEVLNEGIERANGQIIIAMDADTLMNVEQIKQGIRIAASGGWAMPYGHMYRLNMGDTDKILGCDPWAFDPTKQIDPMLAREQVRAVHFGAMCQVFPRDAWEALGGFDTRFRGWGSEDECMKLALDAIWAPCHILDGPVYHLEHDRPGRTATGVGNGNNRRWNGQTTKRPNMDIRNEYARAAGNAIAMREVLDRR